MAQHFQFPETFRHREPSTLEHLLERPSNKEKEKEKQKLGFARFQGDVRFGCASRTHIAPSSSPHAVPENPTRKVVACHPPNSLQTFGLKSPTCPLLQLTYPESPAGLGRRVARRPRAHATRALASTPGHCSPASSLWAERTARRQKATADLGSGGTLPVPDPQAPTDPRCPRPARCKSGPRWRQRERGQRPGRTRGSFHPQRPPLVHAIPGATRCSKLFGARKVNRGAGGTMLARRDPPLRPIPGA